MSKLISIAIIFLYFCVNFCYANKCVKENSCLCRKDKYSKIDISSVLGENKYLEDTVEDITYYFLGCEDKDIKQILNCTEKESPTKASLVKVVKANATSQSCSVIGNADNIEFEFAPNSDHDYQLVYNKTGNATTYPSIRFICDDFMTPFIKVISKNNDGLILSSPKVCIITEHAGLSGGSIFVIIFIVTAAIYFFGGALLLFFIRGATGIEVIPNLDFWRNLPGLVRDGLIFVLSGCKPTLASSAETYDRI